MDWLNVIVRLLRMFLDLISPQLRQIIVDAVKELEKIAPTTPNPLDDLLVKVLKIILAID